MVLVDACDQLMDAVSSLATETRDGWSGPALNDRVSGVVVGMQRTEAELVRTLVQWDGVKSWKIDSTLTPARWLTHHTGLSKAASRRYMRCVRVCRRHPTVLDALHAGEVTVEHVERLASLSFGEREKLFLRDLATLLQAACNLPIDEFIRVTRVWRALSDDVMSDDEFMDRFENRALYISELSDGRVRMDAEWDEDGGSIVMAAINAKAKRHDSPNRPGGPRTIAQRRADALTDICREWLAHQNARSGGPVHTIEVVIDLETLAESIPDELLDDLLDDLEDDDPAWADVLPHDHDPTSEPGNGNDDPTYADDQDVNGITPEDSRHGDRDRDGAPAPSSTKPAAVDAARVANDGPEGDARAPGETESDNARLVDHHPDPTAATPSAPGAEREPDPSSAVGHAPEADAVPKDRRSVDSLPGRSPPDRSRRPRPPLTLESLLRRRCEIRGVGPIGRNTMLRLLCDSYIGRVVMRGPNQVINVGRRSRTFNTAQRRGIAIRDGDTCSADGCDEPGYACDCHHEDPFGPPRTGTGHTDIANGRFKCRYDHVHHHEGRHRHER